MRLQTVSVRERLGTPPSRTRYLGTDGFRGTSSRFLHTGLAASFMRLQICTICCCISAPEHGQVLARQLRKCSWMLAVAVQASLFDAMVNSRQFSVIILR